MLCADPTVVAALVMDYMKGGSLAAVLAKRRKDGGGDCTEIEAKVIMYNIILAIIVRTSLPCRWRTHPDVPFLDSICSVAASPMATSNPRTCFARML